MGPEEENLGFCCPVILIRHLRSIILDIARLSTIGFLEALLRLQQKQVWILFYIPEVWNVETVDWTVDLPFHSHSTVSFKDRGKLYCHGVGTMPSSSRSET